MPLQNTMNRDPAWPPGTVRIETLQRGDFTDSRGDIILQPRPSSDPNEPLNWSSMRKHLNFFLASFYSCMIWALYVSNLPVKTVHDINFSRIDAATPTWTDMNIELGFSYAILDDSYAAGCGALCIGAFFMIPFALAFGRRPVYLVSTAAQFAICIWSAKMQTITDLMLVNILSCFFGALSEVIVQMTVADVYFVHQRGLMNSIYVWFMNGGANLAPLAAGYVTVAQGWRMVWWWMAIFFDICFLAFLFLYEESMYKVSVGVIDGIPSSVGDPEIPAIYSTEKSQEQLPESIEKLALDDANVETTSPQIDDTIPKKTYLQRLVPFSQPQGSPGYFIRHCYQPFLILFTIPSVFFMALIYGAITACTTIMITTLSSYMALPPYNFDSAQIGLMSLPSFIGTSLGVLITEPVSDWAILFLARRNKGIYEPEMRLWVIAGFIPLVPAGILMFGMGLKRGSPWPLLAVGYALCSFGTAPASSVSLTYITDAYGEIVADALVAVSFVRNLFAIALVFSLAPWIETVGLENVLLLSLS
ncbi:major facilitator superfamily domain-containing protein [Penicillium malachiteum]|uniref:major facilitator superfamily domain-containing protein n=1 Tax=Penicillium malachiteum TaxID=1324776 RepID=UPI0025499574|nr:major facilitator superfamily domain-containing protein [Penicillium malachiteum]KAJ5735497.1 major facilitator superfamily domain-containing protein [Penicillium malachiteum]